MEGVYLVGDTTGHYWSDSSPVDILLRVDKALIPAYRKESSFLSDHKLTATDHDLNFHVVSTGVSPETLGHFFGPIYDVMLGVWYGDRNTTTNEMVRPEALLRHANWKLFKAKRSTNPEPYGWQILLEAFRELDNNDRDLLISSLKTRLFKLNYDVGLSLKSQPSESWKLVEGLELDLAEGEDLTAAYAQLPETTLFAVLNMFRYQDLIDSLEAVDEEMDRYRTARFRNAKKDDEKLENTWERANRLIARIVMARGGFAAAEETMFEFFSYVLNNNPFVRTNMRKRNVALKLYNRFYRGK